MLVGIVGAGGAPFNLNSGQGGMVQLVRACASASASRTRSPLRALTGVCCRVRRSRPLCGSARVMALDVQTPVSRRSRCDTMCAPQNRKRQGVPPPPRVSDNAVEIRGVYREPRLVSACPCVSDVRETGRFCVPRGPAPRAQERAPAHTPQAQITRSISNGSPIPCNHRAATTLKFNRGSSA